MGKKQRSPYIGQAASVSQQQQQTGQSNINRGTDLTEQAINDPTKSPLYKSIYNTEAGQMSQAYDNASARQTAKARTAGFGYSQPTTMGAESELRGREASSIGQLPGQVARETVPLELQAGRDIAGAGTAELGAGNQLFEGGVVPLEKQYQDYSLNYTPTWQRAVQGGLQAAIAAA